uniref:carboxypeptidase-like regulatory domain-containing protein n=1 Tax=Pedobacter sp. TaxID=1411316 RepID=UPI003D7F66B1
MKQTLQKNLKKQLPLLWLTGLLFLLLTGTASAQTGASVTGIVKDAAGGALPGVSVKIENKEKNFRSTIATN